jgi:hypothetical protein
LTKQEFIESGVLESHLMGLADEAEQEQVREMMLSDRSLSAYVSDLESDIKHYFEGGSVAPPEAVREIIQLRTVRGKKQSSDHSQHDTQSGKYLDIEVNDTHIKVHKYWRPAFIVVFILSKIFLIAGLYFYFKSINQEAELEKLKTEYQQRK